MTADEKIWLGTFCSVFDKLDIISGTKSGGASQAIVTKLFQDRDQYALLLFQPQGASHHNANKCPYCMENLNGKT